MIKRVIRKTLNKFGYQVQKINIKPKPKNEGGFSMWEALERCINRGIEISTVIDVGASNGMWARECIKFIPHAKYLLIEAQEPHRKELDEFQKEFVNSEYILAAAGNREGKIFFDNTGLFGGLASETPFEKNCIEVPVIRVDNEVLKRKLKGPYLIKLDTHGFEIPIIEGAFETLKNAELIIIEAYNFQLTKDSLKFHQLCIYMEKLGFSVIEIVDFMLRKYDNSFWQMDIFFVPKGRHEFKYNAYE